MKLLDELTDYYQPKEGVKPAVRAFISDMETKSDAYKSALFYSLTDFHSVSFGFPDIAAIRRAIRDSRVQRVIESEEKSKSRRFVWSVCKQCGALYGANMMYCPKCYEVGKVYSVRSVGVSKDGFPEGVIRYNLESLAFGGGESNTQGCYGCGSRTDSFCSHFGQSNWSCSREDFDGCACKRCCIVCKKANEAEQKKVAEARLRGDALGA